MLRGACLFVITVILGACASPPPFGCTSGVDSSGRGLPVCNAAAQTPVCDAPGEMAYFAGTTTSSLMNGSLALCDASNELVCADRTVLPRCIPRP